MLGNIVIGVSVCTPPEQSNFLLWKINSINVSTKIMTFSYGSFIFYVSIFCFTAWFGNLNSSNKNKLGSLVKISIKTSERNQAKLFIIINRQSLGRPILYWIARTIHS